MKEKLKTLLATERELREALEGCGDDLDADVLDSLDADWASRLERWADLLRDLRRPDRIQIPDGELDACE